MVKVLLSSLNSVLAGLAYYLSKVPLKSNFLDIYLITLFGLPQLKNTSPMRIIFFFKMFKIESKFTKCKKTKKKNKKLFFFSETIASENVAITCL